MTAVILLIQFLHYPSFHFIAADKFASFHKFHSDRISFIVAPVMLLELLTAYFLLYYNPQSPLNLFNFLSILLIFGLTAFVSVPLHKRLENGYDKDVVRRLVSTNWQRTLIWLARSFILGYSFFKF